MRRIAISLTIIGLIACGSPSGAPDQTSTTTTAAATSTTLAPPTIPTSTTSPQASDLTTTTTSQASTPAATTPRPEKMVVVPYFYVDEQGHPNRTGPFLAPVAREVAYTVAVGRAAINQLLAGPTQGELDGIPAMTTAIPPGVRLLGLSISEDIATIDLSSEFDATDDSSGVAPRAAQIVFTLSRFDSVAEVVFRQEGVPVAIQIGNGELVSRPVGIWDYLEFAAAITVETPVYGGEADNPLHVAGFAAVFEATFHYALTDADGLIIAEGMAMSNNGTGWGGFDFTVPYTVDRSQLGALIVWAYSAENGEQIDVREYPVILTP